MRVSELAKELKLNSKTLISRLKEMGVNVKSHMSSLSEEQAEKIRKKLSDVTLKKPGKAKAPKKAPGKVAKETARKVAKKAPGKVAKETARKVAKKAPKEVLKEAPREVARKAAKKVTKKAPRKVPGEAPKEVLKEAPEEVPEEVPEGTPNEALIEKRISRTVIRRRKKAEPEPLPPEAALEEQAVKEVKKEKEKKPSVAKEKAKAQKEAAAEPEKDEKEEKVEAQPVLKQVKVKEKERTPARIIDRIELKPRKEDEKSPVTTAKKEEAFKEEFAEREKGKGAKEKHRRKRFRWQKEVREEDEPDRGAAPYPHKRVRYKVKGKQADRARKQKAEVIPFYREPEKTVPKAIKRKIRIREGITAADLSKRMGVKATEVIKKLVELGVMATINKFLDVDTASLVASDFEYEVENVSIEEETIFEERAKDSEKDLKPRCPVVTVMGHVDHGKTSLLDVIRKTNVAGGERGGITQHVGAYRVSIRGSDIVFIDTPGHEAFTTMRARGAQVTDIVILVVAAEEGVKPQTIEAISHAKAAEVLIIVAINKMDKPEANPEKVRQELSNHGLVSEEWGGDTIFVEVSAKKNQGIERLLEMVLLQSEMLELKANPNKTAKGTIIEARLDRGRGPIATVLIQEGTLKVGDSFVSRHSFGKVRALTNDRNKNVKESGPSTPVEISGFSGVPEAGDVFITVDDRKARQTSIYWQQKKREEELRKDARISLENFLSTGREEDVKQLRIIVKADVQGSEEALRQSLENLSTDEVKVNVIHSSVGSISLNDVMLGSASNAIIIGFGVKTEPKVQYTAELEKVDVRLYGIIYDVIDDVKKAMLGMLKPKFIEKTEGKAEVRQVFDISKYGTVAGCLVVEGKVRNGSKARVTRALEVIYEGEITSLKKFKDDAKEVLSGQECGIFLGNFKEFESGDIIESFFLEEVERTL